MFLAEVCLVQELKGWRREESAVAPRLPCKVVQASGKVLPLVWCLWIHDEAIVLPLGEYVQTFPGHWQLLGSTLCPLGRSVSHLWSLSFARYPGCSVFAMDIAPGDHPHDALAVARQGPELWLFLKN